MPDLDDSEFIAANERVAFLAGAAWQREQDAKLVETCWLPGDVARLADEIRAQGSKQDTLAPERPPSEVPDARMLSVSALITPLSAFGGLTALDYCHKFGKEYVLATLQRMHGWYPNVVSNQETSHD